MLYICCGCHAPLYFMRKGLLMDISFDAYRVFYHVAHFQSITLAAKALYLTQPTVSHHILELEKELGCKLFTRYKKGVSLTPEGSILYSHISKAYAEISRGEERLKSYLEFEESTIKIGVSETTLRDYLMPQLGRYKAKYSNTRLHIRNTTGKLVASQLHDGEIDFAIMAMPYPYRDVNIKKLNDFSMSIIAGPALKYLSGMPLSIEELVEFPLICLEQGTSARYYLDTLFASHSIPLHPDIELSTADLIAPMAMQGLGIGFVPHSFCKNYIADGKVVELSLEDRLPLRSICLLTDPMRELSNACQQFISELPSMDDNLTVAAR